MTSDLLVFAPRSSGHFAEFTRWIVSAGVERGHAVALAASPDLLADAPDLYDLGADVHAVGQAGRGVFKLSRRETREALARSAALAPARRTLHTYLDDAIVPMALPSRTAAPPGLAGLLFRAPFRVADPFAGWPRLAARRALLGHLARGPVPTILTLDDAVVPELERLGAQATWLPDPVDASAQPTTSRDAVRAEYGVEPGRRLAVLFGSLEERKGLWALTDALHHVPPETAKRLTVVIAGRTSDPLRARLIESVERVHADTQVQIVFREAFLPEDALVSLTAASDIVLAPYVEHVGSSGIVVRAAAAGVPLLGQASAQMGREIRAHGLGRTVDPTDAPALAHVLGQMLDGDLAFDLQTATAYAAAHRVGRFTDRLYDTLLPSTVS